MLFQLTEKQQCADTCWVEACQLWWFSMFGLLIHMSHERGFEKAHDADAQASWYICFSSELDDLIVANLQKDETGQWFCLQCNFASRKVSHVKTHIESKHVHTGGFVCSICSKVSATRESLRKHIARLHWNIRFSCEVIFFVWLDEVIEQNMWKDDLGIWGCVQCEFSLNRSSKLRNHIEAKHMQSVGFQCSFCNAVSPTRHAMKMHMLRKHRKEWNWTIKLFSALNDAIKAKIFKADSGLFTCYECGYSSKYKTTCQDHIESRHISTSGFICPYCEKFCPTRNALKSHISKSHK